MTALHFNAAAYRVSNRLDFDAINRAARSNLLAICNRFAPVGRLEAGEYVALNPTRGDHHLGSFRIRITGAKAGVWKDFATGDGGSDPVSLIAYLTGLGQAEAARKLSQMLGVSNND